MDEVALQEQFTYERDRFLDHLDFVNWYRYWFLLQAVIHRRPQSVIEVGQGDGLLGAAIASFTPRYHTVDLNKNLRPNHVADVRDLGQAKIAPAECVIIADVLEHLPFDQLAAALAGVKHILTPDGMALVTIPHRRTYFQYMTPHLKPKVLSVPTGFGSPGAFFRRFIKRKIWIDPGHFWEIGDGTIKRRDVEAVFDEVGLDILERRQLVYVDFWVLARRDTWGG